MEVSDSHFYYFCATTIFPLAISSLIIVQCYKRQPNVASAEVPPAVAINKKTDSTELAQVAVTPATTVSPSIAMNPPQPPRIDPSDVGASTINHKKHPKAMSTPRSKQRGGMSESAPRHAPDYVQPEKPKVASLRTLCKQEEDTQKRELSAIPKEVIVPFKKLEPPENAKQHVEKMYKSGDAAKLMEAEVIAFSQSDPIVRLELFSRIIHYVDVLLITRDVVFDERPPKVPNSVLIWANANGMPGIITARAQMLKDWKDFSGPVYSNFDLLPPDGSLLTVYKHAMREDLDVAIRLELMNELLMRTRDHVYSHWEYIKVAKHPLPMLGRAKRRNASIWLAPHEFESDLK